MKKIICLILIILALLSFASCKDDDYYEQKKYDKAYDYYNKNYNSNYRG